MLKTQLYPKTKRLEGGKGKFIITEKIDGSNLGLFKLNGELHVAQRNNVYNWRTKENADVMYKGLFGWLTDNADALESSIGEGQIIFGEYLGMRPIDYGNDYKRFTIFAKARIDSTFSVTQFNYVPENLKYGFADSEFEIPECVGMVKEVTQMGNKPDKYELDKLYDGYCKEVGRLVEGFIVIENGANISKYVRVKDGKMLAHTSDKVGNKFLSMQDYMLHTFGVDESHLIGDMEDINEILTMLAINPKYIDIDAVSNDVSRETYETVLKEIEILEEMSNETK